MLGKIVLSFPVVLYGALYYRHIEYYKTCALRNNRWNFDMHMSLSTNAKLELEWWIDNVMTAENVMTRGKPSWELTIDVCGPQLTCGFWASDKKHHHITLYLTPRQAYQFRD